LFAEKKVYGGLKDEDRIFTNVYRDDTPYIEGALRRVIYFGTLGLRPN
jgi:NADH dehydrogenase (ubiquinone) flavoprotein 1